MLRALRALAPTTAAPILGLSHPDFALAWCTTPPNESRLSRAAWRIKSSFFDHTPRRLQALVRQRDHVRAHASKPMHRKNRRPHPRRKRLGPGPEIVAALLGSAK